MTATKPLSDRQPLCDKNILRLLTDQRGCTAAEMSPTFVFPKRIFKVGCAA